MFKGIFRKKASGSQPIDNARIPDGRRVYAIGDVHGRNDLLKILIDKIIDDDSKARNAESEIIFLGDLVDRGPDSAGVIETAMQVKQKLIDVRFLMGNHEEVFLSAMTGDEKAVRFFNRIGGEETILSYDITKKEFMELDIEGLAARLPEIVPAEHIEFIQSFEDKIVIGDYAFVHAGVKPGVPIDEQKPKHLRWIRDDFLNEKKPFEKVIVYGHTISEDVVEKGNRIGIDTGAYYTDKLTALVLEGGGRRYIDTAA